MTALAAVPAVGAATDAESGVIILPRVARGQTVAIVAASGPVRLDRLRRGLDCLGDAFALRIAPSITAPRAARR